MGWLWFWQKFGGVELPPSILGATDCNFACNFSTWFGVFFSLFKGYDEMKEIKYLGQKKKGAPWSYLLWDDECELDGWW